MDIMVCIDKNNGIGKDGGLLFRIPEDMAYFRRMTVNKTVIMGRKTLESLPGGRPLENRRNIVLTRNKDSVPEGASAVSSIDELKRAIGNDKAFVIGGESIYAMLLDYCERAYVTKVEADGNADRFFPDIRSMPNWRLAEQGEERTQDCGRQVQFPKAQRQRRSNPRPDNDHQAQGPIAVQTLSHNAQISFLWPELAIIRKKSYKFVRF